MKLLAYVHLRNIHGSTGAGRTARQLVEHLAERSDVELQVLADEADRARILPLVDQPWSGFTYHTFKRDTSAQQARWFLLDGPKAEAYWPEADVVFCTAESYVPVRKARLAVTAHDASYFEPGAHARDLSYWKTRLKWELLYKKLQAKVDMFHTVSQFSADRLGHFFPGIKSRLRVAHNGVTRHFFGPVDPAGRQFVVDADLANRPFVLVPGGLHYRKNAELILAAIPTLLELFPDLVIAVVNHTNPTYAARARSLSPRVHLLGFVTDEALHALYSAASVVWYPSRYEGFGLPIVEAMASGASVVASNSASIPEVAGDAAILVDPGDSDAHVEAISHLIRDCRARLHYGEAGMARAALFTWGRSADVLKKHLDALL